LDYSSNKKTMKKIITIIALLLFYFTSYAQDKLCKKLNIKEDKFTKIKQVKSPSFAGGVFISRFIEKGNKSTYLYVNTEGVTLNTNIKGFKILFSDGTIIDKKNQKIDVSVNTKGDGYNYSVYTNIEDDIDLLLDKEITDFRLYIYDRSFSKRQLKKFKSYLKCIVNYN
tara:strand:+ start:3645 stop:4151 length:507 start_codon:yes stop_codon:yes gene_type:complete